MSNPPATSSHPTTSSTSGGGGASREKNGPTSSTQSNPNGCSNQSTAATTTSTTAPSNSSSSSSTTSTASSSFLWGLFNSKSRTTESKAIEDDNSAIVPSSSFVSAVASTGTLGSIHLIENDQPASSVNQPYTPSIATTCGADDNKSSRDTSSLNTKETSNNIPSTSLKTANSITITPSLTNGRRSVVENENGIDEPSISFDHLPPLELSSETMVLVSPSMFPIQVRIQIIKDLVTDQLNRYRASIHDVELLVHQTLDMFQLPVGTETRVELGTDAIVHQLHANKTLTGSASSTGPSSPDSCADNSHASLGYGEPTVYVASSSSGSTNSPGTNALIPEQPGTDGSSNHGSSTVITCSNMNGDALPISAEICTLRIDLLSLYSRLIQHQYKSMSDVLRRLLFHVLNECSIGSMFLACPPNSLFKERMTAASIHLFRCLSLSGKSLVGFRAEVDQLLLSWIQNLSLDRSVHTRHLLPLLTNALRYNASAFSRSVLVGLIDSIATLFRDSFDGANDDAGAAPECTVSLELFDVMLRYAFVPPERINPYTETLCAAANSASLRPLAWHVMRNLLAGDLRYAIVARLLAMVRNTQAQSALIQLQMASGAIQCLAQALWGSVERPDERLPPFQYQRTFVLRVLSDALDLNVDEIALQVAAAMRLLLKFQLQQTKRTNEPSSSVFNTNDCPLIDSDQSDVMSSQSFNGFDLSIVFRDLVWNILTRLCTQYENLLSMEIRTLDVDTVTSPPQTTCCSERLVSELGMLVCLAERLYVQRCYRSDSKLFAFLETYSTLQMRQYHYNDELPSALVSRVVLLVDDYEQRIHSANENWTEHVTRLMELFFHHNTHSASRIKALRLLHNRIRTHRDQDEVRA